MKKGAHPEIFGKHGWRRVSFPVTWGYEANVPRFQSWIVSRKPPWSWYNDHVYRGMVMKSIPAGEFKARCLALMDNVQNTREPLVITKRGKPVAKLVPADDVNRDFIGRLEGIVRIVGDIESPVVPLESWKILR